MKQVWKDPRKAHVSARMKYADKVQMLCEASYEFLYHYQEQFFTLSDVIDAVKAHYPATEELAYNLVYDKVSQHLLCSSGVFNLGGWRTGLWTVDYRFYDQSSFDLGDWERKVITDWFSDYKKKLRSRKTYWIFGLNTLHWCRYSCTEGRHRLRFYFAVPVRVPGCNASALVYDIYPTEDFRAIGVSQQSN